MKRATVIGTGLVALDVVVSLAEDEPPRFFAGGTCGNVLAILSYLGWRALPVARLGDNGPAQRVLRDLKRCGVETDYTSLEPSAPTPIIVEKIRRDSSGNLYHAFSWTCPRCGSRLPSYAAVTGAAIETVMDGLPAPEVFFFDRVSRGALDLAEAAGRRGALIFFEPSGVGEPRLFREALALARRSDEARAALLDLARGTSERYSIASAALASVQGSNRGRNP